MSLAINPATVVSGTFFDPSARKPKRPEMNAIYFLAKACLSGNLDDVIKITEDKLQAKIVVKNSHFPLLYFACQSQTSNKVKVVENLLKAGANPNENLPLGKYYRILNFIIDQEVQKAKNPKENFPFRIKEWETIVEILVKNGAEVNHLGSGESRTLLEKLCFLGNEKLISLFVSKGAKGSKDYAAICGATDAFERAFQGSQSN